MRRGLLGGQAEVEELVLLEDSEEEDEEDRLR